MQTLCLPQQVSHLNTTFDCHCTRSRHERSSNHDLVAVIAQVAVLRLQLAQSLSYSQRCQSDMRVVVPALLHHLRETPQDLKRNLNFIEVRLLIAFQL
jgi:hypothetical protein